jgi:hypothetical protein
VEEGVKSRRRVTVVWGVSEYILVWRAAVSGLSIMEVGISSGWSRVAVEVGECLSIY